MHLLKGPTATAPHKHSAISVQGQNAASYICSCAHNGTCKVLSKLIFQIIFDWPAKAHNKE